MALDIISLICRDVLFITSFLRCIMQRVGKMCGSLNFFYSCNNSWVMFSHVCSTVCKNSNTFFPLNFVLQEIIIKCFINLEARYSDQFENIQVICQPNLGAEILSLMVSWHCSIKFHDKQPKEALGTLHYQVFEYIQISGRPNPIFLIFYVFLFASYLNVLCNDVWQGLYMLW